MAEEVVTVAIEKRNNGRDTEKGIWDLLFRPDYLDSLFTPYEFAKTVTIKVFTTAEGPASSTITLNSFFPFSSIDDLKMAIYEQFGKDPVYAPDYQFLATPFGAAPGTERAEKYDAADFEYRNQIGILMLLLEPFKNARAEQIDTRFTDSRGEPKLVQYISRGRALYEDVYLKQQMIIDPAQRKPPTFHLYLYRDIVNAIQKPKPLSQPEHNGRMLRFFPNTTPDMDGRILSSEKLKRLQEKYSYYEAKQKILVKCLTPMLVEFTNSGLDLKMKVKDVKYLRFVWLQQQRNIFLDKIFYELAVNENRPFLRFFPVDMTPVSKIHVKGVLPIPDLADPCLLLQWAKETSPTEERDYLMGKIRIRPMFDGSAPVYATLQAITDGTGAIVVQPTKPAKRLDPYTDLGLLKESIKDGIKDLPFANAQVDINEANLVAMIRIPQDLPKPSAKQIRERLDSFRGFFQEIPPLEGESPLISLRYKAVSNFFRESRVAAFLTQLESRKLFDAASFKQETLKLLKEEFIISDTDAENQFNYWKEDKQKYVQVQAEYDVYKLKDNPGIDILVYSQQSDYFFHFYRLDSYVNLQRIITLLCLMLTAPSEVLCRPAEARRVETTAQVAVPLAGQGGLVPQPLQEENGGVEVFVDGGDDGDASNLNEADYFDEMADEEPAQATMTTVATALREQQPVVAQQQAQPRPVIGEESLKKLVTAHYFVSKLMEADNTLFNFNPPAGEKKYVSLCAANETRQPAVLDQAGYERMMNEYREDIDNDEIDIVTYSKDKAFPAKLDKKKGEEYQWKLKDKYKDPNELADHTFTVLKYGTEVNNEKYYLCCEYFCLRDQMLIRKDEFENTVKNLDGTIKPGYFRENALPEFRGQPKEANHCPFCNGTVFTDFPKSLPGQTVFRRKLKPKSDKRLTYIGFYTKDKHPLHFGLPCCFNTVQETTPLTKSFFKKVSDLYAKFQPKEAPPPLPPTTTEEGTERVQPTPVAEATARDDDTGDDFTPPNYDDRLKRVKDAYILDEAKMPLETGSKPQIGLLPQVINEYFGQKSESIVSRIGIKQMLETSANAFLRVGVDNRSGKRNESFFAALAPFLRVNTVEDVKTILKKQITPEVFVAANYGNLMLEFYDPSSSNFPHKKPSRQPNKLKTLQKELKNFAQKLGTNQTDFNEIQRIYLSYLTFKGDPPDEQTKYVGTPDQIGFIDDPTKIKEYRQFANLLAQPGIITDRGLVFIVLEILPNGALRINCPPYGYTEAMKNMDVGFLLHVNDIWEPIFYTGLVQSTEPGQFARISTLRFLRSKENSPQMERGWPTIVKQRVSEFMENCKAPTIAPYVGIQQLKKGSVLLSATVASKIFTEQLKGIVRDSYNHIVCALFEIEETQDQFIPVPVADDGLILQDKDLVLGWTNIKPGIAKTIIDFYKRNASKLAYFKGYTPKYYIIPKKTKVGEHSNIVEIIQLENGIFIPVYKIEKEEIEKLGLTAPPGGQPEEVEWDINKRIFMKIYDDKIPELEKAETDIELEEIYEHFRLSFSNWLAQSEREGGAGQLFRDDITRVIKPDIEALGMDLPVYEKRKRLNILLYPILYKWLTTKEPPKSETQKTLRSLLRVDCREFKDANSCKGRCIWAEATGDGEKCRIHVPPVKDVDVAQMFLNRLIEELIRFPRRRDELLRKDKRYVSSLTALRSGTRLGNTYIVPEDTTDWVDFLRMDCDIRYREKPKYLEEFSGKAKLTEVNRFNLGDTNSEEKQPSLQLSSALKTFLGPDDPKTEQFGVYTWDRKEVAQGKNVEAIAGVLKLDLDDIEYEPTPLKNGFSKKELQNLSSLYKMGVVQINLNEPEENQLNGFHHLESSNRYYIFVVEGNAIYFLQEKNKPLGIIAGTSLPTRLKDKMKTLRIRGKPPKK